jgi:exopolysaccharide biosynthesis polyprenyl glycosylphosphotransferase
MSRRHEFLFTILGDVVVLSATFFISWKASAINTAVVSWNSIVGNLIVVAFWLFLFQSFDLYEPRYRIQLMNEVFKLFRVLCLGAIIIIGLGYLVNIDFIKARGFVPAYLVMLPSIIAWRFFWRGLVGEYIKPQREKVLIFQNGDALENYSHFNVVEKVKLAKVNPTIPAHLLDRTDVEGIVIESNGHHEQEIFSIISGLTDTDYEIFISPRLYPMVYQYFLVQKVPESPFLKIIFNPLSRWDQFLKRIIDVVLALLALFAFWPMLLLISVFIKLDSRGPVLYTQKRVGYRGKEFTLYKFRSMISDAEKYTGPVWAEKNDKRITRVGRVLRPLRLDEWPQLLNVLRGDMSFVGPRPERPAFVERFKKELPLYNLRLNVNPGITGWAQVKSSYDESFEDVKRKLEHDLQYVNDMSLRLDLKIFLKTVLTVLKKQGAH